MWACMFLHEHSEGLVQFLQLLYINVKVSYVVIPANAFLIRSFMV